MLMIMEVLLTDIDAYLYPRKLGRMLGISHRAASMNLKSLARLGIFLESKMGRENHYRVNLSNPATIYFLSFAEYLKLQKRLDNLPRRIKRIINELQEILVEKYLDTIFSSLIFGSYAKGYYTKKSDLDLLLITKNKEKIDEDISKISRTWGINISPSYLTLEDFQKNLKNRNPTMEEILKNHIMLIGAENFWMGVAKWRKG